MNLKEFNLSDLLRFKPNEGKLLLEEQRMLLFSQEAMAFLHQVLSDQLGERVTHAVLSQFGYRCGFGDFGVLRTSFSWDSEDDALGCGPLMHCWEGIVAVEPVSMMFDRKTGHFDFRGIWRNSYEAEISLKRIGLSTHPVCSSLTGYASGWCSAFFGQELLAIEHRCMGKGDPHCEWQVKNISDWGPEAGYWYEALKATNLSIAQDLEVQVKQRTQEVQRMLGELEEKNKELTRLDQMKTEFLANVSHEVRTPLTLLLGPLQGLLQQNEIPTHVRVQLERMNRNATQLYSLVNQLLDFSKLEAGMMGLEIEAVNTHAVLNAILEGALSHAEAKNIELRYRCTLIPPPLRLDRKKFEKIVVNLLGNALKFTPPGGRIILHLQYSDGKLLFSVSDTGIGIAKEYQECIFERFQQVDATTTRRHEGTGIGLALVREFCTVMGGQITVESVLGEGACFKVQLPTLPAQESITNRARSGLELFPGYGMRSSVRLPGAHFIDNTDGTKPLILVAEDNEDLRDYMVDLLSKHFRVLSVGTGTEALSLIEQHDPMVVLSDVMMPEMDGMGLLQALKTNPKTRHVPFVLVTARAGSEASAIGLMAGADDYIVKPFTDAELIARVTVAVRMRSMYDQVAKQNLLLEEEASRRKQAELDSKVAQEQLLDASRQVGRAEVATSILHNAGNVLNSIGISVATLLGEEYAKPLPLLERIVHLVENNRANASAFFSGKQGGLVLDALSRLTASFKSRQTFVDEELGRIATQIEQLILILNKQNMFVRAGFFVEEVDINALIRNAVQLCSAGQGPQAAEVKETYSDKIPLLKLDRQKILQILVTLLKNAFESFQGVTTSTPQIHISSVYLDDVVTITVADNGMGILPETMLKIFNSGFTTKAQGNGFGLHSSANLAKEMRGRLTCESDGLGCGATFRLELPVPSLV